jgi:hypothetical protein
MIASFSTLSKDTLNTSLRFIKKKQVSTELHQVMPKLRPLTVIGLRFRRLQSIRAT